MINKTGFQIDKGKDLNEGDVVAIAEYGKRYPTEFAKPELLRLINDSPYSKVSKSYNKATTVFDVANVIYFGARISKDNKGNLLFHLDFDNEYTVFFNKEDIAEVYFEGYVNVSEEEAQRIFSEQENEIEYPKFRVDKTFEENS